MGRVVGTLPGIKGNPTLFQCFLVNGTRITAPAGDIAFPGEDEVLLARGVLTPQDFLEEE